MIAYETSRCTGDARDDAGRRTWARKLTYHAVPVAVLFDRYQPDHTVSRAQRTEPVMKAPPERVPYTHDDDAIEYTLPNCAPKRIQRHSYGREIVLAPDAVTVERAKDNRRGKIRLLVRCKACGTTKRVYVSDWNGGRGCGACWDRKRGRMGAAARIARVQATRPLYVPYGGKR